jgi:hypothetical protein
LHHTHAKHHDDFHRSPDHNIPTLKATVRAAQLVNCECSALRVVAAQTPQIDCAVSLVRSDHSQRSSSYNYTVGLLCTTRSLFHRPEACDNNEADNNARRILKLLCSVMVKSCSSDILITHTPLQVIHINITVIISNHLFP